MSGQSPNVLADKLEALRTLVPEAFVEGQLDPAQLAEILGTNTTSTNEDGERYGLNWPGKKLAYEEVAKQTYCTLTHDEAASSEDWQNSNNIFIEGENLETLRVLQKAYFNKVKMIYIDPPYNTGKDFVYHDNFRQTEEEYCDECNVTENGHLKKALKLNTRDTEYDLIYVNGDNNLENLKKDNETWKVRLIEEEFQVLMFDVKDI